MEDVKFDSEAAEAAARAIDGILSDMSSFTELLSNWSGAGAFAAGHWMEQVVNERSRAVLQHADALRTAFAAARVDLETLVRDFDATDTRNADTVRTGAGPGTTAV